MDCIYPVVIQYFLISRYERAAQFDCGGHEYPICGVLVKFAWKTAGFDGGDARQRDSVDTRVGECLLHPVVKRTRLGQSLSRVEHGDFPARYDMDARGMGSTPVQCV